MLQKTITFVSKRKKKWLFHRGLFSLLYSSTNCFSKKKLTFVDKSAMLVFNFVFWVFMFVSWVCILDDTSPRLVVNFAMLPFKSAFWASKSDRRSNNLVMTFFNSEPSNFVLEDTCSNANATANMAQKVIDIVFEYTVNCKYGNYRNTKGKSYVVCRYFIYSW